MSDKQEATGSIPATAVEDRQEEIQIMADEAPEAGPLPPKPKKRRKKRKAVRRIITAVILLAVVGGIVFGMLKLFSNDEEEQQALTEFTYLGSVQSKVQGSGLTKPKDSAAVSAAVKGEVTEVFFNTGDYVMVGDLLFTIDMAELNDKVTEKQEDIDDLLKEKQELLESQSKLTITAPFGGKIIDCSISVDDYVTKGQVIGTLINDSKMRVSQYFSYAYENDIYVGMAAQVSIPSGMATLSGVVEKINMVERVSPEGSMLFEVVVLLDNPGTLAEGAIATASVKSGSGEEIYPYDSGKLEYYEKKSVKAEVAGTCKSINMIDYMRVSSGATLAVLDSDDFDEQIKKLNESISTAEKALATVMEDVALYSYYAPIDGVIMSSTVIKGQDASAGTTGMTISDTSIIYLEAQVDEMDISKVYIGLGVEVSQYGEMTYFGTVTSISMEGVYEYGYSYFPVLIELPNTGSLMPNMYCSFSFVASEQNECIVVPVQAVKYTEQGTCLFIRAEAPPENALELGEDVVPAGFYAVPVEVGISDDYVVEIISGVDEGVEVFTQFMVEYGNMYGYG